MTQDDGGVPIYDRPVFKLVNVQEVYKGDPTVRVPNALELQAINVGVYVQALFEYPVVANDWTYCHKERLWVRVEHHDRRSRRILGILTSDPVCIDWDQLRWGDYVVLHETNILQINLQCPSRLLS